jgi:hypothetical protein
MKSIIYLSAGFDFGVNLLKQICGDPSLRSAPSVLRAAVETLDYCGLLKPTVWTAVTGSHAVRFYSPIDWIGIVQKQAVQKLPVGSFAGLHSSHFAVRFRLDCVEKVRFRWWLKILRTAGASLSLLGEGPHESP